MGGVVFEANFGEVLTCEREHDNSSLAVIRKSIPDLEIARIVQGISEDPIDYHLVNYTAGCQGCIDSYIYDLVCTCTLFRSG
jgi:hypothetical protein